MKLGIQFGLLACSTLLLAACGGAEGPPEIAAKACNAQAAIQLGGKPFRLDLAALAATMKDDGGGSRLLTAPVVVDAGLASESTQQLECTVRMAEDGSSAAVLHVRFIW